MSLQTPDELKTALRNAVKATEAKPHYFALLLKGSEGLLIVDKRKIPSATVDAAKKKAGSSTVVRGICFGGEDSTVFQTLRSPGGNVASTIKKAAQTQAGLSIKPELRVGAADDGGEDEAETQEAPTSDTSSRPTPTTAPGKGTPGADPAAKAAYDTLLARVQQEVQAAQAAGSAAAAKVAPLLQLASHKAKAGDHRAAVQALQSVQAALQKGAAQLAAAAEAWRTRRAAAVSSLKAMAAQIASAKHGSSARAIIEIQAVVKNLTAEPKTLAQVSDLQRWLGTDEVVEDVCDLIEDLRTPLYEALEDLRSHLAA